MNLRNIIILILIILTLTSCESNDNNENPTKVSQAIKLADQSGAYPKLDRSKSVAGPDNNNNGVRDDIDNYIDSLSDSTEQKQALSQVSSAIINAMLVDTSDQNALVNALKQIANASACLHSKYETSIASSKNSEMEKLIVNTKERFIAYESFSSAASGHSFILPQGDGCAN